MWFLPVSLGAIIVPDGFSVLYILPAYLLINGSCRVVGCRRLGRGPPFPQRFGGASSVVEQRTRLVAEAEAVKVEGPLWQPVGHRFEPCRRRQLREPCHRAR